MFYAILLAATIALLWWRAPGHSAALFAMVCGGVTFPAMAVSRNGGHGNSSQCAALAHAAIAGGHVVRRSAPGAGCAWGWSRILSFPSLGQPNEPGQLPTAGLPTNSPPPFIKKKSVTVLPFVTTGISSDLSFALDLLGKR
jgi:hypothetical protein